MDKFPDWAQVWLKSDERPVSHGLNLALKLEHPSKLPLLLWDIVVAKPKIQRALEELSFIHYARFVPSWDGTALMVITEFDGPLEPYVMDFVIAIGDVFDALLSYVPEGVRPTLPIREHPEEFWEFVKQWNRVPFAPRFGSDDAVLFPPDFDYPIYSAYSDLTVIDIVGPRTKLLPPAIDHPAAFVDLDDVQGNILSGYRASRALHQFFEILDVGAARRWLATVLLDKDGQPWGGVRTAARWTATPKKMANVGFTYAGLKKLLPSRVMDLQRFPQAFQDGAAKRHEINGDVGPSDPSHWRFGKDDQDIDVVLSLYTKEPQKSKSVRSAAAPFFNIAKALRGSAEDNGMKWISEQEAHALEGELHDKVYFGYRDGIALPRISGQCEPHEPDFQPAASPGEFLLGKEYRSIFGGSSLGDLPADLATNGTFGAFRLLEQHVEVFNKTMESGATKLGITESLLKAKLLGRWESGQPLVLDPDAPSPGRLRNDFDFALSWEHPRLEEDLEGLRCPIGAHIRRTNPRTARVAGQRHSRRLIRRGMPTTWDEAGVTKQGLMGLFIGASLERQFEFIQQQWIQGDLAARSIRGSQDPIAGLRSESTSFDMPGIGKLDVPPLVTTRGSLYVFFPGISMLRGLDRSAVPSALRVLSESATRHDRSEASPGLSDDQLRTELTGLRGLPGSLIAFVEELLFKKLDSTAVETLITEFAPQPPGSCGPEHAETPSEIKPLDPSFIANPYDGYQTLRKNGRSVVWVKEHEAYWVLKRDDCLRILSDPQKFLQQPSSKKLRGIITMDGPRHSVVRAAVKKAFDEASKREDAILAEVIDAALRRLDRLNQFDFVTEYGAAVPREFFWRVFGLPSFGLSAGQIAAYDALAQTMMLHYSQPKRPGAVDGLVFADAAVRLTGHLGLLLARAVAASLLPFKFPFSGTLIGEIAQQTQLGLEPSSTAASAHRTLGFLESLMTLLQLVLASMSGQFLLGTAMRNFLMPDPRTERMGEIPWMRLADIKANQKNEYEPALRRALEEARRIDSPVTIVERYAAEDLTVGGVDVQKDCAVFAVVGSGNRDGIPSNDPELFIWDRDPQGTEHLSLGHGIHLCVGKAMQDKLIPTALTKLIEKMPDLRLCDTTAVPAWYDNIYFRVLQSLPVTRCPRST